MRDGVGPSIGLSARFECHDVIILMWLAKIYVWYGVVILMCGIAWFGVVMGKSNGGVWYGDGGLCCM